MWLSVPCSVYNRKVRVCLFGYEYWIYYGLLLSIFHPYLHWKERKVNVVAVLER
uniref:Uncharacterized protein n=1 Tax=Arundo donax TaxID=35708 RepID=A0A0A9C2C0_ARUDO